MIAAADALPVASAQAATAAPRGMQPDFTSADPEARRQAIGAALARPETLGPFEIGLLSAALWGEGRRLQGAFWFFVFQARSRPWAELDVRGAGVTRAALNEELGGPINGWIAGDLRLWQDTARRAIDYEARLALPPDRPAGVSVADWTAAVARARREYRAGFEQTLARMDADELGAARQRSGLPVGPPADPGPPLDVRWR